MQILAYYLIGIGVVLLLSVLAGKISSKFGIPALLLFLIIGMLLGADGPGGIPFDQPIEARALGIIALIFILYSGGLETNWKTIRHVMIQGISLSTIGVLITTIFVAVFAHIAFGANWLEGLLLGAIISPTDAAAVFSVLKSQGITLRGRLNPLLEFESGTNDPMAIFLTIGLIGLITRHDVTPVKLLGFFVLEMGLGVVIGYYFGRITAFLLNRITLSSKGLYTVLSISMVLLTYGCASVLYGSGFLAVYIAGIVVGDRHLKHKENLISVHDGIAWLMQISMFLVLGMLILPSQLMPVMWVSIICALFLCFVARPASVFISLSYTKLGWKNKVMISWMGLRGATPIILATFPLIADIKYANIYFHLAFFIVLVSVLLQGTTIPWLAKKLNLERTHSTYDSEENIEEIIEE